MWHVAVGAAVLKRAVDGSPETPETPAYSLPPMAWGIIVAVTICFIPLFAWASYSVKHVYTTLAIIENPTPASYEAVPSDEADATPAAAPGSDGAADAEPVSEGAAPQGPITASIRRTANVLKSSNGWRGNYRGIWLAALILVLSTIGSNLITSIPFVLPFVGSLVMMLALVQFNTAWVHAVIRADPHSTSIFKGGLPPFRRTFEATSIPVLLSWLSLTFVGAVSMLLAHVLGLKNFNDHLPQYVPALTFGLAWKTLLVLAVAVVLFMFIVVPANVVLVRVQASLLPPEEDTVVPFDRSFSGAVEPAVLGGLGYVTAQDAFRTFSPASWRRVVLLYVKAFLVSLGVNLAYAACLAPVILLTRKQSDPVV